MFLILPSSFYTCTRCSLHILIYYNITWCLEITKSQSCTATPKQAVVSWVNDLLLSIVVSAQGQEMKDFNLFWNQGCWCAPARLWQGQVNRLLDIIVRTVNYFYMSFSWPYSLFTSHFCYAFRIMTPCCRSFFSSLLMGLLWRAKICAKKKKN